VVVPVDFDWEIISGVGDSKKVAPQNREAIFRQAQKLKKEGKLDFVVIMGSAKEIDKKGIAVVIKSSIEKAIQKLELHSDECFIKLDGALRAPSGFAQETIIKGDSKELVIGLASILAKVTRDTYMEKISHTYAVYDFATHKGYGTKSHCAKIVQHGLSPHHRVSYCQKLLHRSRV
jgi:ribonuclease HII